MQDTLGKSVLVGDTIAYVDEHGEIKTATITHIGTFSVTAEKCVEYGGDKALHIPAEKFIKI